MSDTIKLVTERMVERPGWEDSEGRHYDRSFHVQTTGPAITPTDIFNHNSIPDIGDNYPGDANSACTKVSPKTASADGCHWHVAVTYEQRTSNIISTTGDALQPWDQSPVIRFGFAAYRVTRDYAYGEDDEGNPDTQGNPTAVIENSAGDPFDPPVMEEEVNMLIIITTNVEGACFYPDRYTDYKNTLNKYSTRVAGVSIAAFEGKMRDIKMEPQQTVIAGIINPYWEVTFEIEVDRATHKRQILDQGYRHIVGGEPKVIMAADIATLGEGDKNGPVQTPVKLKDGVISLDEASFLTFQTQFARSWNWLHLPSSSDGS